MSALRFRGDSKSVPNTPPGTVKRNATFSPRIIFHDTWTSTDYDRRGEIATCNRLTPMLAQQIKEELNSFKMVRLHMNSSYEARLLMQTRKWRYMRTPKYTLISFNDNTNTNSIWLTRTNFL